MFNGNFSMGNLDSSILDFILSLSCSSFKFLAIPIIVCRYLIGVSLNYLPESCNPNEYDFTVIFSKLIHLADSSMPAHQDVRSNRARIQKKSDGNQFTRNDDIQYYSYAQDNSNFRRRSDYKM